MKQTPDRRSFLKIAGATLGMGVLYKVGVAGAEAAETFHQLGRANGEKVTPFTFVQLSDTHVGFQGPPNPMGTAAFERAVQLVNRLPQRPDLVLFTGDLIHDTEDPKVHAERIAKFKSIASQLQVPKLLYVPGEHDAGLDEGNIFREAFGPTNYSFDHRGVHFVALDNVSKGRPMVGAEQLAWLKKDLSRFLKTAPIVVFTHRPLFNLRPEWEWFTSDGDDVMNVLAPYQNVTVLYGHIHTEHEHEEGHINHYSARSLAFAFPDPATEGDKKPLPFNKEQPFKNLGLRILDRGKGPRLAARDVELTIREFDETNGIQQMLKEPL